MTAEPSDLYRCRDCTWQGRGISAATEHWHATQHDVKPAREWTAREKAKSA